MKKFLKKKLENNLSKDVLYMTFALKEISINQQSSNESNKNIIENENNFKNEIRKTEELKFNNLISFNEIDLCSNNLIKIYPSIGFLNSTTVLKLCCNNLTEIPPEIGYMKNLEVLNIANNKIEKIPDIICFLKKLKKLDISNNYVKEIPIVIKRLSNLTHINLKGNQIEIIPSEIGELINLISINLADNAIQYIPIELNKLNNLLELDLGNCPLASSFDECRPAFTLSSFIKDLIVSRNQKLLLESTRYQNNATLDMINELEHYKKYYSNTSSLSISFEQNQNKFSLFNLNHSIHKDSFLERIGVNSSSTSLNQGSDIETLSLSDNDNDNNTIEEPINNDNKIELRIPTLKELSARVIVRNHLSIPTNLLQEDLINYLSSYKTCSFCHGPYFETYIRRIRIMYKEGKEIPFEYRLCKVHFNTNEERIKEMFKIRPVTAPRSLNKVGMKRDIKYKYNDASSSTSDNSSCTLNNSIVPNTSSSSSSSSSLDSRITKSSISSPLNLKHKSVKCIFNLKSKHHHKLAKDLENVEFLSNYDSISSKSYSHKKLNEDSISKSITVNELLNMKQPSLPVLHFPESNNDQKNI
ncbi:hypothetical protein BCR36DRAFT_353012 [Piromyces finnis]|uniref:L domain-like protein n=1 Tax=Piromyces finnis TaxID=1754191 RepID=A0A1Y1VAX7_9FUNG|nr:hypothetical protein BCR36DRAFT_353012 [Piromyces finnis]|eukprot:ORX50070.1 hypothetical protein BCR36DRAFT_353012 [Piromyces finnis]